MTCVCNLLACRGTRDTKSSWTLSLTLRLSSGVLVSADGCRAPLLQTGQYSLRAPFFADLLHPNHAQKTSGMCTTEELKYAGVVTWSGTPFLVAAYTSLPKSVAHGLQYDSLTVRPSYLSADTAIEAPTAFILSPLKDLLEQLQVVDVVVLHEAFQLRKNCVLNKKILTKHCTLKTTYLSLNLVCSGAYVPSVYRKMA